MESNGVPDAKPPYGGYQTFWNFIVQLSENPLPQRLDRSVMGSRGGSSRADLYTALRFFGLIDADKAPTNALRALAAEPTAEKLREIVERRYAPVIALGLETATPRQVDEELAALGATPSTIGRSRTFFLNAAEATGIDVGHTLKTARAPASSSPRRRSKPKAKPKPEQEPEEQKSFGNNGLPPLVKALVSKMPAEADGWDDDDAKQWLDMLPAAIAYDYKLDLSKLKGDGS
jgi:hypothetical protein